MKGLKRDLAWIELSEDVRSTILRGILDSEIIPNELLGTPAPEENEDKEEDDNEVEPEDRQLVVEEPEDSDEEAAVEQQQVKCHLETSSSKTFSR